MMNDELRGSAEQVLAQVQDIFSAVVPDAVCELQDYKYRIGCGTVDANGHTQEVLLIRKHLTRERAEHGAIELRRKLESGEGGNHGG